MSANDYLEATWETGQNGWSAFNLIQPSVFSTSSSAPAYMGTYGTFRGDSATFTSGREKQSASLNVDPSGSFTSTPLKAYASFAFKLNSAQISTTDAVNFTTVNKQRDALIWVRMFNLAGSLVADGGSPAGTNVKMSIVNLGGTKYLFLNHIEGANTVGWYPSTGLPISAILGRWMMMEFYVEVLRGPMVSSGQNGLIVTARMSLLDCKRPRVNYSWYLKYDAPTTLQPNPPSYLAVPYTAAHSVEDISIGANKLRTISLTDDEISIDYDEFRAGQSYKVAPPRALYGGPWNVQARLSMWDPGSNVSSLNDFSGRWQLPMEAVTKLEMQYDEHFFSNNLSLTMTDRQYLSSVEGSVTGSATTTSFNTDLAPLCADAVFVGSELEFITGNRAGQKSTVTGYSGTPNKTITISPALTGAPASPDRFVIRKVRDWYARFLERGGLVTRGTQLRLDILATDSRLRDFQNPTYSNPAYPPWDEVGPIWGSFFIDKIELNSNGGKREITIEGYGPSEFLKRTRSRYNKSRRSKISDYPGASDGLKLFDHAIDLRDSTVDASEARLPFSAYGENLRDVESALGRLLGDYVIGIETSPYKNISTGGFDTIDFRDAFFESRDDRDTSSTDYVLRTIPFGSPKVTQLIEKRDDGEYANKWKFDGASFVGEIRTVMTARGRKGGGKPGFSSDPFLKYSANADEKLSQGYPTTGLEAFPFSFVGWVVEIVDVINRVGFYKTSDDPGSSAVGDKSQFQYEGGSRGIPTYAKGIEKDDIVFWLDESNKVSFQTTKPFPGAKSDYDSIAGGQFNTRREAVILKLTPSERNVERVVYNSKASVFPAGGVGVAVGDRAKIVQSGDVIGWLQAGIAAQVDAFHQARASMTAEVEEWMVKDRPATSTDNRVALTDPAIRMIIMSSDNWRVGQLDESGRVPTVGYAKLYQVRKLTLTMTTDGWKARWELGSPAPSIGDVLSRFAEQQARS